MSESTASAGPGRLRPGATNSLADIGGIRVGHAQRAGDGWRTGVTVVLAGSDGMTCGADVRGGAPGTRETDLLDPRNLVDRVQAIVFAGGSAYGLAAVDGVVARLADAGVGFAVGSAAGQVVPIVPAAVIFDLGRGGSFRATPGPALGAAAYDAAGGQSLPTEGSVGAGAAALAGGFAGGVGMASAEVSDGIHDGIHENITVAALAVVNASGSPVDHESGELYGARLGLAGEFAWLAVPDRTELAAWQSVHAAERARGRNAMFNTTIGVLATDASLTKAQCARLAGAGHDGIARAIRPAHTMLDGDTVFGLAAGTGLPASLDVIQALLGAGADTFSRAVAHAIVAATGRPGAPSYLDVFPSADRGGAAGG